MKILLVAHHKICGPMRSLNFGTHLSRLGHDVTLLAISAGSRMTMSTSSWNGLKIVESPDLFWGRARTGWDPWDVLCRVKYLLTSSEEPFDLAHGFECRPVTIFPILALRRKHKKLIYISDWNDWWGRGGLIEEQRPFWYKPILGPLETYFEESFRAKADGVTVIATSLARRAHDLGVAWSRLCWIPQGVDTQVFRLLPRTHVREKLGLPADIKLAVFSARVIFDLDLVLKAFTRVSRLMPEARLMLLGKKSKLTAQIAREHDLEGKIYDLGMIPYDSYPDYLACADIFLLPYRNKIANIGRWPTKLGEYLSLGKPIVSNPVGDLKDLFEQEEVGLLAREDPTDFADKIMHLFEDPHLCDRLGSSARRVAEEQLAWPILTQRLDGFYRLFA